MATEKRRVLNAYVSEETFHKFKNGEAVSNNGLRSPKGNFWPDQPEFSSRNEYVEQFKAVCFVMLINTVNYGLTQIVLPSCKHFWFENLYPCLEEKFDKWKNRKNTHTEPEEIQDNILGNGHSIEDENNIINLDSYRKRA